MLQGRTIRAARAKETHMSIDTIAIHGGYNAGNGEPRALPIYQSTTYHYTTTDEVAGLFDLTVDGHMYSRISNPTVIALRTPCSTS